jgi:murein DD-endopeptidase MepM/ murein hydrolase activator NlpD
MWITPSLMIYTNSLMGRLRSLLIPLFLVLLSHTPSFAFQAEVAPSGVNPGDPFVLRVTGLKDQPHAQFEGRELYFSSCGEGCYLAIGVLGLEDMPGTYEIAVRAVGVEETIALEANHAKFPVQNLTLPEDKVTLSPEDQRRVEEEDRKLSAIWDNVTERLWEGGFILPLDNSLSTVFGARRTMNGKKKSVHRGIDIRGKEGEGVRASNTGRVVLAEELFYGGNTVVLDHGLGIYTIYMHLSRFAVGPGEKVLKGQVIGEVGSTGRVTGPHLHFGIKVNTTTANPVSFSRLPL